MCVNGALRLDNKQVVSRWNHYSLPGNFYDKSFNLIRRGGSFSRICQRVFAELMEKRLGIDAYDLVNGLRDHRQITQKHFESAGRYVMQSDISTSYEFFNILTRSAQDLGTIQERQKAETNALRLAMIEDGFEALLSGEKNQRKEKEELLSA